MPSLPATAKRTTAAALLVGAALVSAASSASAAPVTVTLAFDDGMGTRNDPAKLLAPTRTRATFYVNTAHVDRATTSEAWSREYLSWDQLAALHAAGHEIAGHTLHHTRLTPPGPGPAPDPPGGDPPTTDPAAGEPPATDPPPGEPPATDPAPPAGPTDEEVRAEVCDDRRALTRAGYAARSFAYPFGRSDARSRAVVHECGYIAGRTTSAPDRAEAIPPVNPFAIEAFNAGGLDGAGLIALVQAAKARGGWVQLVFHDICDTDDALCNGTPADAVTPRALKDLVAALAADPEVRVKTAGDVVGADAEATAPAFEPTAVGSGTERAAVVRNTGAAPLVLGTTRLVGGRGTFTVVADACAGRTIAPNGSCAVSVRFAPTASGRENGRLELPGNTDPRTSVVPLTATAVPPSVPPVDPPPVDPPPGGPGDPGSGPGDPGAGPGNPGSVPVDPGTGLGDPGGGLGDPDTGLGDPGPVPPAPQPPVDPSTSTPEARLEATRAAAVRRARARLVKARGRALRVCGRKATRRARVACRLRVRTRYARRLDRVKVVPTRTARG